MKGGMRMSMVAECWLLLDSHGRVLLLHSHLQHHGLQHMQRMLGQVVLQHISCISVISLVLCA